MGVADRRDELGDVRCGHPGVELEAHVDHLRAVVDREAHALRDHRRVALAARVEHAHRHQLDAVGQAGQPVAVVGRLGDRARDVGAVAVVIDRVRARVDEVRPRTNCVVLRSGERRKRPQFLYAIPVSSTATITPWPPGAPSAIRFPHACSAPTPNGPERSPTAPPPSRPASRRCRVVGVERRRRARARCSSWWSWSSSCCASCVIGTRRGRGRGVVAETGVGDVVRHRPQHPALVAQAGDRARHAGSPGQGQDAPGRDRHATRSAHRPPGRCAPARAGSRAARTGRRPGRARMPAPARHWPPRPRRRDDGERATEQREGVAAARGRDAGSWCGRWPGTIRGRRS